MYFYSNEHGSRVYFDEMGPPWPKHPCMAQGREMHGLSVPSTYRVAPVTYGFREGRRTLQRSPTHGWSPRTGGPSHAEQSGEPWVFLGQQPAERGALLHVHRLYDSGPPHEWWTSTAVAVNFGDVVFIRRDGWMSFFDFGSFSPAWVRVSYVRRLPRRPLIVRFRAWLRGEPPM